MLEARFVRWNTAWAEISDVALREEHKLTSTGVHGESCNRKQLLLISDTNSFFPVAYDSCNRSSTSIVSTTLHFFRYSVVHWRKRKRWWQWFRASDIQNFAKRRFGLISQRKNFVWPNKCEKSCWQLQAHIVCTRGKLNLKCHEFFWEDSRQKKWNGSFS